MNVLKIKECGFDEAVLGFSLSYNTDIERVKQILPKYAFGVPGEGKFLEQIMLWVDVTAPRFWWSEADTYRVGTCKQSESSMHTITKKFLTQNNFEYPIFEETLDGLNNLIHKYKSETEPDIKIDLLLKIKDNLPEGFLQRRIWMFSYKTLQNIYVQRNNHKLPQWKYFISILLSQIDHPEFIVKKGN
jgi:hypothetical protein